MNITGLDSLKKLSNDLRRLKRKSEDSARWGVEHLSKETKVIYEDTVDSYVYNAYDPVEYDRTGHIRGDHGAVKEEVKIGGANPSYKFYIDEESRDPVDGKTWREKADNLEKGVSKMYFKRGQTPFNRPFVNKAQNKVGFELKRTADAVEKDIKDELKRI